MQPNTRSSTASCVSWAFALAFYSVSASGLADDVGDDAHSLSASSDLQAIADARGLELVQGRLVRARVASSPSESRSSGRTVAGLTDLAFLGVDGIDGVFAEGDTIEFVYDVENVGDVTTDIVIDFYISTDEFITTGDTLLDMMNLGAIMPGQRHIFLARPAMLTTIPALADGDYYIGGILAADDNGANNTAVDPVPITIDGAAAPARDLELLAVDAMNGIYQHGDTFGIEFLAGNAGGRSSSTFQLPFYASADTAITAGDHHFNPSDDVLYWFGLPPGIAAIGATITDPIAVKVPDGLYYMGGILDPTTPEAVSDNHIAYDPVQIKISNVAEMRIERNALEFTQSVAKGARAPDKSILEPSGAASEQNYPALLEMAQKSAGRVPVILGLDMAFRPEGRLDSGRAAEQQADIRALGDQVLSALQGHNYREKRRFRHIPYIAIEVDAAALQALSRSPLVATIEEDRNVKPLLASSNGVIGSPTAWAAGYDGAGQVVAVLDTGVDSAHPWFTTEPPGGSGPLRTPEGAFSKIVSEACFSTSDADWASTCPGGMDEETGPGTGVPCDLGIPGCNHGTHVAGIAAGYDGGGPNFGVAWAADLIAINVFRSSSDAKICDGAPPCITASDSDIIAAIEHVYSLRNTFDIASINMSLGGGFFPNSAACGGGAYEAAAALARSAGIAPVAASGNDGAPDMIGSPACAPGMISVTATTDADQIAVFSNVYPDIHLAAPGVSVTSALAGTSTTTTQSGTSMATPHVAGAWAVMRQATGGSVDDILADFIATGTPVDDTRYEPVRAGGSPEGVGIPVTGIPRINLDLAIDLSPTSFSIFNDGGPELEVTDISPDSPAPWLTTSPATPFMVPSGGVRVVQVEVDFDQVPLGTTMRRLTITSNDPDDSPWPDGVDVTVTKSNLLEFFHGFEEP